MRGYGFPFGSPGIKKFILGTEHVLNTTNILNPPTTLTAKVMAEAAPPCPDPETEDSPDTKEDQPQKPLNMSLGAVKLRSWLNKSFRIQMHDGRVLIGVFLCTDRDSNVILGSCTEYLPTDSTPEEVVEEPRMLGLVMVPGKHILSVAIDESQGNEATAETDMSKPFPKDYVPDESLLL